MINSSNCYCTSQYIGSNNPINITKPVSNNNFGSKNYYPSQSYCPYNYQGYPQAYNYPINYSPYIHQGQPFIKCGNKILNEKTYTEYKLQNGTSVLINSNSKANDTKIRTTIKPNHNLFINGTESHLFEHVFGGNNLGIAEGFNNGYFSTVDDANGHAVSFYTICDKNDDILSIINNQSEKIYNNEFSEAVFEREKQALDVELATDPRKIGNRNEINGLSLSRLRGIRNSIMNPQNVEIIVEGNVNPDGIISKIAYSKANIPLYAIKQLPFSYAPQSIIIDKGKVMPVTMETKILKPQNMSNKKFQASLEALRLLAIFSSKTNLNQATRTFCYGPDIKINKQDDNNYTFTYNYETLEKSKDGLKQVTIDNLQKIRNKPFTQKDIDNVKSFIKTAPSFMWSNNLRDNLQLEQILNSICNLNLNDLNSVIDNINTVN